MDSVNATIAATSPLDTCSRAGFLSDASLGVVIFLFGFCVILAPILATFIKGLRYPSFRQPINGSLSSIHSETLSQDAEVAVPLTPPYSLPSSSPSPSPSLSPIVPLWVGLVQASKDSDEHSSVRDNGKPTISSSAMFVLGTILLGIVAWCLWIIALIIQYGECFFSPTSAARSSTPVSFGTVFPCLLYGLLVLYASCSIVSWFTLLRNLWGGHGGILDKVPTDIFLILAGMLMLLPIMLLVNGVVAGIRNIQKCCCNSVLEKEDYELASVEMVGLGGETNEDI